MTAPKAPTQSGDARPWADAALFGALAGCAFLYQAAWPHNLSHSDESHFLYHAKLVLGGAVPYRDFFDFYTPLSYYLMAVVFGLFGVQLGVAKLATALVYALTAATVFVAARRLGARRGLAVTAGVVFLGLGPPTWPHASPHWLAALLLVWLLAVAARRPFDARRVGWLGVLTGVLASMQQQTGAPIALGIAGVIASGALVAKRCGGRGDEPPWPRQLLWFAGVAFAITAVVLLVHVARAGFVPIFEQIVVHPLTGYRAFNRSGWGEVGVFEASLAEYTVPGLLELLPGVLLPVLLVRGGLAWRARDRDALERVLLLGLFGAATALSIQNRPDFIHLAFTVCVYLAIGAEVLEWALAQAERVGTPRVLATGLCGALLAASGLHLQANLERARSQYAIPIETAIGRVDVATPRERVFFEKVRDELAGLQDRVLYCYPVFASLYLTTDARNPTPHEILLPDYKSERYYQETLDALEAEQVRNVFLVPGMYEPRTDRVYAYVRRHYECVAGRPQCWLFRRRD